MALLMFLVVLGVFGVTCHLAVRLAAGAVLDSPAEADPTAGMIPGWETPTT